MANKSEDSEDCVVRNKKAKWWVVMKDPFLGDKLAFPCDTYEQAEIVKENAKNRGDMKYVNIRSTKPNFSERNVIWNCKDDKIYPSWYKKGFFSKKRK